MRGDGGEVGIRGGGRKEVGEVGRGITVYLASSYNTTYFREYSRRVKQLTSFFQ